MENNSLQIVDVLLRAGAETNIYDIHHMSALHIAAANGNADIGQMLANRDAKLDVKDMVCGYFLNIYFSIIVFVGFLKFYSICSKKVQI